MIKLNGELCIFKYYNDGSTRANISLNKCYNGSEITWLYDNSNEEILELYYLANHLRENSIKNIILNLPYIVNARQDRVKSSFEIFTLKYFANLINSLDFERVNVYDPHSYVSTALINHINVEMPIAEIAHILLDLYPNAILCFTDEGGYKRYHSYFQVPFIFGIKERNWETQKIETLKIAGAKHMIAGHDIVICDDILSRGSTLYLTAKTLKEMGANHIYCWISHCENTVLGPHVQGQSLLDMDLIDKIYTTNSIWRSNHPKVEVIRSF